MNQKCIYYIYIYINLDSIKSRNHIHSRRKTESWQKKNQKKPNEVKKERLKPVQLPGWPCKAASLCARACVCVYKVYLATGILQKFGLCVLPHRPIAASTPFYHVAQLTLPSSHFCIWNLSCCCCCYFWLDHHYGRDLRLELINCHGVVKC